MGFVEVLLIAANTLLLGVGSGKDCNNKCDDKDKNNMDDDDEDNSTFVGN